MAAGKDRGTIRRLAWFVGLWAIGVATVSAIGLMIRMALGL